MAKTPKPRATVAPIFRKQAAAQFQKEDEHRDQLRDAYNAAGAATFVSTSICVVTRGEVHATDEIVYDNGIPHYRLTPLFWSYLCHAFNNATRACEAGKLDAATYSELLNRISLIYNAALAQFSAEALKSAERTFTPAKWKRHCERLTRDTQSIEYEDNTDMPTGRHPVSKTVLALVDAIRDQAIALGWTMHQLYCNVRIANRDWGLVCYIGPEDRLGTITRQSIEIVHRTAAGTHSLHFYNHEVEQTWLKMGTPEVTA